MSDLAELTRELKNAAPEKRSDAPVVSPPPTGQLLDAIIAFLRRYVVLATDAQATAIALWVLHTWALDGAHATPYLVVVSPEKRAGKTRLLEVLELLIRKPWRVTSASEAAMFRKIANDRPTLLLDEVDAIFGSNTDRTEPLRAVINSGNRPGAAVARCVGEGSKQVVKDFNVYCPKVLAGIDTGRLPDTIRDRGVEIRMERKTAGEHVERFRVRFAEKDTKQLRAGLDAWATASSAALLAAVPELPQDLDDRAAESWEALFAIADLAGNDWPDRARGAAVKLVGGERDDAPASAKVLAALHAAFNGHEAMATAKLLSIINDNDELPFGGWNDGDGLKARDLAKLLKRYRIKPRSIRLPDEESTRKGYLRGQFGEAWERYLPSTPKSPAQAAQAAQASAHRKGDVPDVPDVPDKSGKGAVESNGHDPDVELARLREKFPDLQATEIAPRCRCGDRAIPATDEDGDPQCTRCGRGTA